MILYLMLLLSGLAFADQSAPQLTSGGSHSCALDGGIVKCWGDNKFGQTDVPPLKNPRQITAGAQHTCALDDEGVKCWGDNQFGQTNVPPLRNPRFIDAGAQHTCALTDDGPVCWWYNPEGQSAAEAGTNAETISAGIDRSCVLKDGEVSCWGKKIPDRRFLAGKVTQLSVGARVCVLVDGAVKCSMKDYPRGGDQDPPAMNAPYILAAGPNGGCAADTEGVKCWGDNYNSYFSSLNGGKPPQFKKLLALSVGLNHACGADEDGIQCWGAGYEKVPALKNPRLLRTDYDHTCAFTDDGLQCWGEQPDFFKTNQPALGQITSYSYGRDAVCAVDESGLHCWSFREESDPVYIPAGLKGVKEVAMTGIDNICVAHEAGITCWGMYAPSGGNGRYEKFEKTYALPGAHSLSVRDGTGCAMNGAMAQCWELGADLFPPVPAHYVSAERYLVDDAGMKSLRIGYRGREKVIEWNDLKFPYALKDVRAVVSMKYSICVLADSRVVCHNYQHPEQAFKIPALKNPSSLVSNGSFACALDDEGVKCWGSGFDYIWDVPKPGDFR